MAGVLGEGVEAVGLLGVGEGHPHARGEGGVEHHGGTLKPRCQIHRGHCADTLPVQDDVLRADAVPAATTSPFKSGFKVFTNTSNPPCECCEFQVHQTHVRSVQFPREGEQTGSFCLPGAQGVPGCIDISVKVLLRRLASAYTVA